MRNRIYKILSVFVLIISLFTVNFVNKKIEAAESASKLIWKINTNEKNQDGAERLTYPSGMPILLGFSINFSEARKDENAEYPGAKMTIKIPKKSVRGIPLEGISFQDASIVKTQLRNDTDDHYVMEYTFSDNPTDKNESGQSVFGINGATIGTWRGEFRFPNFVTQDGDSATVEWILTDKNGNEVRKDTKTLTASAAGTWDSAKYIYGGGNFITHSSHAFDEGNHTQDGQRVVQKYYNDAPVPSRTRPNEYFIDYQVLAAYIPADRNGNFGIYSAVNTVTFKDYLPQGASLAQKSIDEGWVYDAATHSASKKMNIQNNQLGRLWFGHHFYPSYAGQQDQIRLVFNDQALTELSDKPGWFRTQRFTNKMEVIIDEGLPTQLVVDQKQASHVFEAHSIPKVTPYGEVYSGTAYHNTTGTIHYIYNGEAHKISHTYDVLNKEADQYGLKYHTSVWNAGRTEDGIIVGSLINKIKWRGLSNKMYFNAFKILESKWGDNPGHVNEQMKTSRNKLYGVLPDGSREEIFSDLRIGSDRYYNIEDRARKYVELELEFTDPLYVERNDITFDVFTKPTAEEADKFKNFEYDGNQGYHLQTEVNHTHTIPNEVVVTKEGATWRISEGSLPVGASFDASTGKVTLPYDVISDRVVRAMAKSATNVVAYPNYSTKGDTFSTPSIGFNSNFDTLITIPENRATQLGIIFTDKNATEQTVTLVKDGNGDWSQQVGVDLPEGFTIDNSTKTIRILRSKQEADTQVEAEFLPVDSSYRSYARTPKADGTQIRPTIVASKKDDTAKTLELVPNSSDTASYEIQFTSSNFRDRILGTTEWALYELHGHENTNTIAIPKMRAHLEIGYGNAFYLNNSAQLYKNAGNLVDLHVGSSTFGNWTSGDFESSMKLITLLPSGVEFVEDLGLLGMNDNGATDIKPAKIENNFKGTGRTAVIYDYKHIKKVAQGDEWTGNFANFKFRVNMTLKQQEGPKQVDYWLVWDKDNIVRPHMFPDKDILDLDNDGNTEEQFIHRTSSLELYLPSEVTASKGVSIDKENFVTSAPAQDLGKDIFYRINVNNSSEFGLRYFEIIDVLPYVGDFNIVSNDAGTYPKRGTQFSTPLVKALEDIPENAKYLGKWDIFYSEDNQGTTEQTANANWKTKDEVDLSKVKLIKIKLKDGETFDSKTKIDFIINSKIPYDTNLENFSIAYNSFAMKTSENGSFVEANIVSATNVKYEVDGVLFFDTNRNTVKDENEPVVSNYKVYLVDENGQQVNDIEGNPIMATTDENGYYHMNVYSRGNYYVKVAKNYADEEFSDVYKIDTTNEFGQPIKVAKPGTTVAEDGLVGNDAIEDNGSGKTPLFTLNPAIRKATRNAGFVPSRGEIRVVKKDEEGKLLENVTFELFKDGNSLGRVKTNDKGEISFGNLEFGEYKLMEIETLTEYLLDSTSIDITVSKTDPIITKNIVNNFKRGTISLLKHDLDSSLPLAGVVFELLNQNNEVVQTQSTAANGILLFENVKYGDYIVREKETLVTHILDNTTQYPVSIRNNNETVHVLSDNKAITNEAKKGTVVIKKVDAETGAPLKGVIFALKQGNAVRNTAITNEDGIAQFIDVLYGKYDVVETKPLDNYIMPENPKVAEVTITDHRQSVDLNTVTNQIKKGHVEFKKVDVESNAAIAGVTFTLNQNGEEKYTAISNDQGVVRFENVIYGDYTLVEKATVENYNLSSETRTVAVRENGATVTLENFTNQIKKGHVEFKKVDAESNAAIAGVTFTLNQNGEEKYTAISNDQGVVRFENVIYGDYTLVEKATVENYNLSSETRTVAVRENGATVTLENFTNQIKKGHVEFKKVDVESNAAIAGVTFTLNQNGEEKYTAISNDQGVVRFENVIYGDYTLVEKATVENYNLSSETRTVAVRENGATVTLENFTNQIKKGHVEFVKVDSINSDKKLAGVVFTLSQNGTEKYRATSDINGVVRFEDVIYGDYELAEVETLENYLLSDVLTGVMIRENGVTIHLGNYPNQEIRGNIVFKKVDSETQENIANAKFTLTGVDGTTVEAISDENGEVHFKGIPYGVYEIEESEAATGYVKSDKKLVAVIKEDGELVELENYENTKIKGSIVIKKVDADSKEALAGVEFGIYQNGVLLQQGVTDSLGLISFENMVYGEYTVKEIKALAGYDKTEQEYVVKFEKDKEVVEVIVENHKTKVKPIIDTSDAGSAGLWFISLLSLFGFLFFARKKSQ